MSDQDRTYSVIVEAVPSDDERTSRAAREMSDFMPLSEERIRTIFRRAPIQIFALSEASTLKLRPVLRELSDHGLTFRVTSAPGDDLAVVTWARKPVVEETSHGRVRVALQFNSDDVRLTCSGCGGAVRVKPLHSRGASGDDRRQESEPVGTEEPPPEEASEDAVGAGGERTEEQAVSKQEKTTGPRPERLRDRYQELTVRGEIGRPIRADIARADHSGASSSRNDDVSDREDGEEQDEFVELDTQSPSSG